MYYSIRTPAGPRTRLQYSCCLKKNNRIPGIIPKCANHPKTSQQKNK